MKERIGWIDVARGLGIILVVYGHALPAESIRFVIYAFHMPLFFLLSGLVFSYKKDQTFVIFLKKNVKAILFPYFLFAILSMLLWVATRHPAAPEITKQFLSIFYGNGTGSLLAFNNLLWFLPCLFLTRLGWFLLLRISTNPRFLIGILLIISVVGYFFSISFPQAKLFFGAETAVTAIVFLGAGYLWKTWKGKWKELMIKHGILTILVSFVLCGIFAVLNFQDYGVQVDMRLNRLNNFYYFYLAGFAGTFGVISLSQLIKHNRVLEYLGRHSLVLFAWHLIVFSYITQFLYWSGLSTYWKMLPRFVSPVLYTALAMTIILGITSVVMSAKSFILVKKQ